MLQSSIPYQSTFKSILGLLLLSFMLLGCLPQQANNTPLDLHNIYFYDAAGGVRYSVFYGEPRNVEVGGQLLTLSSSLTSEATEVPQLSFPEALYVNNFPFLETALQQRPASFTANRSRFTSDINFKANETLNEVIYYDGFFWFTLTSDVTDNVDAVLTPKRRFEKLQGFGQLTNSEAQALSSYYESLGDSLVIGLLPTNNAETKAERAIGFENYRETEVYIQRGIPLDEALVSTAVKRVQLEILASGQTEAIDRNFNSYEIATNDADYTSIWNVAHAKMLNPPTQPNLNLGRETILGIFLSSRPDTNYSLDIVDAIEESGELYIDVVLVENTEPQPLLQNTTTTSDTIYNPWAIVRILRPDLPVIWIRDANSGDLLGAARR